MATPDMRPAWSFRVDADPTSDEVTLTLVVLGGADDGATWHQLSMDPMCAMQLAERLCDAIGILRPD